MPLSRRQAKESDMKTKVFKMKRDTMITQNVQRRVQTEISPVRQNSIRDSRHHISAEGYNQSLRDNQMMVLTNQNKDIDSQRSYGITQEHKEILKNSLAKDLSAEEFEVFIMACNKTKLDPFMRQIYAVKRNSKNADGTWSPKMTVQTGIDGYRLIAERTERYAPGQDATYVYDDKGTLVSSTAYIKKQTRDGTWHDVSASAHMEEYCQCYVDKKTGQKVPTGMWVNMPRTMLAKCAEALALRKAFPAEMSGVYTKEEMSQADIEDTSPQIKLADQIRCLLDECDENYRNWVYSHMKEQYKAETLSQLPMEILDRVQKAVLNKIEQKKKQVQDSTQIEIAVSA